jgi:hypothetical protein
MYLRWIWRIIMEHSQERKPTHPGEVSRIHGREYEKIRSVEEVA